MYSVLTGTPGNCSGDGETVLSAFKILSNSLSSIYILSRFSDAILRRIFDTAIGSRKKTAKKLQTLCG